MSRLFPSAICVVLSTLGATSLAFATASLEIVDISTGSTLYVADNGSVICNGPDCATAVFPPADQAQLPGDPGAISLSSVLFDGFVLTTTAGGSNSPNCGGLNGPNCLNTTNINATNITAGTATLSVYFADTGFAPSGATGLLVGFSTPGQTGANAVQTAYATSGTLTAPNPLGPGVLTPTAGLAVCGTANLALGASVGPATTGTNCATPGTPFSLEIATTFTASPGQGFNLNGTISAIPEPASIALFGTALALCASAFRRKRKLS